MKNVNFRETGIKKDLGRKGQNEENFYLFTGGATERDSSL